MDQDVARMEEGRSAFKILTGKPTRKRTLGGTRRRHEYNIRLDPKEISISTTQDKAYWSALVNTALKIRVQYAMELIS